MDLATFEQLIGSDVEQYKMPKSSFVVVGGVGELRHAYFVPAIKKGKKVLYNFEDFYNIL